MVDLPHVVLIHGGTVFDGSGADGVVADVLVRDGVVADIGPDLPTPGHAHVEHIDATGRWVMPGFVDLHTHYDAEIEIAPSLSESVRHGVTTVLLGSCSLSMVMGDPVELADMFCRVEGIPRSVVKPLFEDIKDWDGPAEYLSHLDGLPMGPNTLCLLGHSTIRAAAMGLGDSLSGRRPTGAEQQRMDHWLREALDAGYVGLSISTLPWDKMDGEAFRSRPMPSVFGTWREYRRLARILRERGRVLQGVPNISTKVNVALFLLESMGLGVRPALKTTVISMLDARSDRFAFRIGGFLSRLANRFLGADFTMQALPEVFDLWADGIDVVVFEEFEAGTAALHLQDLAARRELLDDPAYRARFKKQWHNKWFPRAYHRNFAWSEVLECPADPSLVGRSFQQIADARGLDVVDAYLDLVIEHGDDLRWYSVLGNDRREWLEWIVAHPDSLIGFSDAGAHLRNMAHYNFPLRMLKLVRDAELRGEPFMTTGEAVHQLTARIADWLDIDAGHLQVGRRADVVVVDPQQLDGRLDEVHEAEVPGMDGLQRLVRRNDSAVPLVLVNGRVAVRAGQAVPELGSTPGFGQVLRAGQRTHEVAARTLKESA